MLGDEIFQVIVRTVSVATQELPFVRLFEVLQIIVNCIDVYKTKALVLLAGCYEQLLLKACQAEFATSEISDEDKQLN